MPAARAGDRRSRSALALALALFGCGGQAPGPSPSPVSPGSSETRTTESETPAERAIEFERAPEPERALEPEREEEREEEEVSQPAASDVDAGGPAAITLATARPSTSTSIGGPNEGRLEGGVPLPHRAPGLVRNPRRPGHDAYYGTYELVRALVDAAASVERELPGGTLTINDIGLPQGGPIAHHGSHRAGRDVDVLFYVLDPAGAPRASVAVPIDPEGRGTDYGDLVDPADDVPMQIDLARTWRFVQAILQDDDALVQRIFVVEHVRTMLLAEAARAHAPRAVIRRFEDVTCQPGYPHDDHLHVRFFCTNEDLGAGCEDASPIYPWRRDQLADAGLEPVLAHPRRRSRETAPTSPPAGTPMDAAVTEFLARRETWAHQPHPGRPYCR